MSQANSTWQHLSNLLETQKAQTMNAIRSYPPPIPACDAQFNYLLEKRDRLTVELNRLHKLENIDNTSQALIDFITSSACISEEAKQDFRLQLEHS